MSTSLHIRPFNLDAHRQIITLFRERWQFNFCRNGVQGIYTSDPRMVDFHIMRLQKMAESTGDRGPWLVEWRDTPLAIVALGGPSWHSQFVGNSIGRLDIAYVLQDDFPGLVALAQWLKSSSRDMNFHMLSCRIAAENHPWIAAVTQDGWRHVGSSLKYVLQPIPDSPDSHAIHDSIYVRDARESDLSDLEKIVLASHRFSHFFNEPDWPQGAGQAIFAEWMRKTLMGQADKVFVAESDGTVLGFVSLMETRALKEFCGHAVGVLDFICVDPAAQGRGVGRILMDSAFKWCQPLAPALELRTMLDNYMASAWYQRLGFRLVGADHHFHAWL